MRIRLYVMQNAGKDARACFFPVRADICRRNSYLVQGVTVCRVYEMWLYVDGSEQYQYNIIFFLFSLSVRGRVTAPSAVGGGGERCLPRCPRGPRRMGQPGRLGAEAGSRGLPEGCNSPKVHGSSRFLSSGNPTCSSCSVVYSLLSLSLSLAACSPPPTASSSSSPGSLVCGTPGGRALVGPDMPSPYQGTLACPKPGTPGDLFART